MNPSSSETPGISLPPPAEQRQAASNASVETDNLPATPEQAPTGAESAPNNAAAQAMPTIPPLAAPSSGGTAVQTDDSSTTKMGGSKVLQDDDLIEKEWVNKAKRIVEHTRNDPHQQSEQLTLVKADYMKKRYNKTIKVEK